MNIKYTVKKYLKLQSISLFFSMVAIMLAVGLGVLYASGSGKEKMLQTMPKFILEMGISLRNRVYDIKYLFYNFPENNLPDYQLYIGKDEMKKLNDSIPNLAERSKADNYLPGMDDLLLEENRVYVPAQLVIAGRKYDVEVRYRGGGFPHWSYDKKSLRIKFAKNDLFNGKSLISLVIPLERDYMIGEFNNFRAKRLGLTVLDSGFVTVSLNGSKPSLYWEAEHFTKEFVEANELSGDANLYSDGDFWKQQIYTDLGYWKKFLEDPAQTSKDNYSELNQFLSILNNLSDEFFNKHIFDILDRENFYAWNIHSLLVGSIHQDYSHNIIVYFDKSMGKLRIIPWDTMVDSDTLATLRDFEAIEASINPLVQRILANQEFMRERNERLWKYLKDGDNLKEELSYFDDLYIKLQKAFYNDPIRSRSYRFYDNFASKARLEIENNFKRLRSLFEEGEASFALENNLADNNLDLVVSHSDSLSPIYLSEFLIEFSETSKSIPFEIYADKQKLCEYGEDSFDVQKNKITIKCGQYNLWPLITHFDANENKDSVYYAYYIFMAKKKKDVLRIVPKEKIDLKNVIKVKAEFKNSYTGKKIENVFGFVVDNTEFANFYDISKTPQEFVAEHSQFYLNKANEIVLPGGLYIFSKNIIIPRNTKLNILPGAKINLANDASFISYSPVIAKGTETNKIYVRGEADGKGENFGVLDNKGISEFEYVEFSGGGESTVNGAFFSGMLAIHHADSIIKYSKFANAAGDDALNIKYASSTVAYNLFQNNSADAIDYDFSAGVVEHNKFVDNGNDGIDTSGSPGLIQYNKVVNSGDKCISIGEKSAPRVFNNVLDGCNIGVEIKDLSEPILMNNVIINNNIGINEYQKKEIFGGGMGKIYNTIIWDNKESIILDNVSIIEVFNSSVEGGYKGDNNFIQKPGFNDDFTNTANNANMNFQTGGNTEILRELLGINLEAAPVGLLTGITGGI